MGDCEVPTEVGNGRPVESAGLRRSGDEGDRGARLEFSKDSAGAASAAGLTE